MSYGQVHYTWVMQHVYDHITWCTCVVLFSCQTMPWSCKPVCMGPLPPFQWNSNTTCFLL